MRALESRVQKYAVTMRSVWFHPCFPSAYSVPGTMAGTGENEERKMGNLFIRNTPSWCKMDVKIPQSSGIKGHSKAPNKGSQTQGGGGSVWRSQRSQVASDTGATSRQETSRTRTDPENK